VKIERPQRVAVFRALQLGDMLCAVPALRALRRGLPRSEIVLIGLPWAAEFARRFHDYLDGFIAFPGFPGLPEQPPRIRDLPAFLSEVHARHFDLALQMHGSGEVTNAIVELLGAKEAAGFYSPGHYIPASGMFFPYSNSLHEVERQLRLVELLGFPAQGTELQFPTLPDDTEDLPDLIEPGRPYVCLHPGSRSMERRWPPERFAAVGDALAAEGYQVVATGAENEIPITRALAADMSAPVLDLAGKTSLGGLAALLRGAKLLVSNDTGVVHIAAALNVPRVIIASDSNTARWAPLNKERQCVISAQQPERIDERLVLERATSLLQRDSELTGAGKS
jgi:ADP-heptose:LPS heptosyltransferase